MGTRRRVCLSEEPFTTSHRTGEPFNKVREVAHSLAVRSRGLPSGKDSFRTMSRLVIAGESGIERRDRM